MNCVETKLQFQSWWDGDLPFDQAAAVEEHIADCPDCTRYRLEMEAVREFLAHTHPLPEAAAEQLWGKIRPQNAESSWGDSVRCLPARLIDWVSFDRRALVAQLLAAPLALLIFTLMAAQFSLPAIPAWTYSVVQVKPDSDAGGSRPAPVMVHVLQNPQELRSLMDTAWKLPYEDSFSLVADIQPEGHAQIQRILEPPRSLKLLEAVDLTLRTSRFAQSNPQPNSVIIYSFQKIDVYSGL